MASEEVAAVIAVVTGAARGIGRGIARVLGEAGATVYLTDKESRAQRFSELPGTVEDTAEQVAERGGRAIPVPVDHADDTAVAALFERIRAEHGRLDLLVANACAGNVLPFRGGPFWTLPAEHWHNMMEIGVRSHLVAARYAVPLLIERGGLVVLTGYTDPEAEVIGGHLYYDLAMTSVGRLARSMAHDLRPHGVTALAISPGFTRTEAISAALGGRFPPGTDSIEFAGRAVRALLEDPEAARHAGRIIPVAELAAEYGFTDIEVV